MTEPTREFLDQLKRDQDAAYERLVRTYNAFHQAQKDYRDAVHRIVEAALGREETRQDHTDTGA